MPDNLEELILKSMPDLKPGIKLPNTDAQWQEVDLFFRAELPISEIDESNVNECVLKMTNTIYDFFAKTFGTMKRSNASDEELHNRYENYTNRLKRKTFGDGYTKLNLEAEEKLSPTFNLTRCTDYFKNVWKCSVCPRLTFNIPDWIPNLAGAIFQTTPPTYAQITSIVRKMKSKGSVCPLDQLSIIPFKKSAYL